MQFNNQPKLKLSLIYCQKKPCALLPKIPKRAFAHPHINDITPHISIPKARPINFTIGTLVIFPAIITKT